MPKIHFLDDALISKIAAGEVIERPASVVKELVENSLDAHAKTIIVSIEDGGKRNICVRDDGEGMDEDDCKNCIGRHATSKVQTYADLFSITTLGFRGEALASIAAIADVTLTSKQRSSSEATRISVSRGKITKMEKIGAPQGTEITVEHLFSQTPARKKYLKGATTEAAMIAEVMTRFALLHHTHHFQLFHNNQNILTAAPVKEWKERITELFGHDMTARLLPLYHKTEAYMILGFVSKPELARIDKRYQYLYVNGRWVKSRVISDTVYDSYGRLLFHGRYPCFFLQINLSPKLLDVNVHPTKKEVRFLDEQELSNTLREAIGVTLRAYDLTPETTVAVQPIQKTEARYVADTTFQSFLPVQQQEETPPFVVKGVVHNCFFLLEDQQGMMLVDQHAADERVQYEQLVEQYASSGIVSQQLLEPMTLTLPAQEILLFTEKIPLLEKFGFLLEPFGAQTLLLRASPVILGRQQAQDFLRDIVTELTEVDISRIEEKKDAILARMACRKAVKKGDTVEISEMYRIMKKLLKTKTPYTCPHGRPTMITLSTQELERKFKRCG